MFGNFLIKIQREAFSVGVFYGQRGTYEDTPEDAYIEHKSKIEGHWLGAFIPAIRRKELKSFRDGFRYGEYDITTMGGHAKIYNQEFDLEIFNGITAMSRIHPIYGLYFERDIPMTHYRLAFEDTPEYEHSSGAIATHQIQNAVVWCIENCVGDWVVYRGEIWFENASDSVLCKIALK